MRRAMRFLLTGLLLGVPMAAAGQPNPGAPTAGAPYKALVGEPIPCTDGQAAAFPCQRVDLLAFLPISDIGGQGIVNDIWGWTDPETGKEYALVGRDDGTSFVDVSDPVNPMYLGDLPLHAGATPAEWRDIKVYADQAFIVADNAGNHGM